MFSDRARDFVERRKAATFLTCENMAAHMERKAKRVAPWTDRTAHARQSINSGAERHGNTVIIYVAHGVRYGRYLEKGTPAHIIVPKHKKVLYWAGAGHPVKKVNHPGTRKLPAVVPAAEHGQKLLKRAIRTLWGA